MPTSGSSYDNDARGTLLGALAQIAASLATGEEPTEVLGGVLARVALAVDAVGVSLWLSEGGELRCEARVGDYTGWIRRSEIWGVSEDEAIN